MFHWKSHLRLAQMLNRKGPRRQVWLMTGNLGPEHSARHFL